MNRQKTKTPVLDTPEKLTAHRLERLEKTLARLDATLQEQIEARKVSQRIPGAWECESHHERSEIDANGCCNGVSISELSIAERLCLMEREVCRLSGLILPDDGTMANWLPKICGSFSGSKEFEEAMKLGAKWRASSRPKPRKKRPTKAKAAKTTRSQR